MVQAARLYYVNHRSVGEIARELGCSPSTVSRLLSDARAQGIVEIRVRDPRLSD